MSKSSPFTLILVAFGGVAIGYFAAQAWPNESLSLQTSADAETAEQNQMPDALVGLDHLTFDESMRGEITSQGELNGNDGSRYDRYAISLEEGDLVELSLRGALQGVIALYDDQLQLLTADSVVRQRVEASGDYIVVVSGADASSYGPYTLNSRKMELSDTDSLVVGEPVDSWLQNGDRTVTLTVESAGMYQIDMRSDDLDSYLVLEGPNGYRREDDDGGGNLDAQIADFLAPGEYTITARSYADGAGLFTLSAQPRELPGEGELRNDGTITPGESLNGWFSGQELGYELAIEEAGMYQIDMGSSDVDAYLVLDGPADYHREDDDSGGDLDARITDFLAPGVYQLTARTAYGTDSGLFTLAVEPRQLPDGVELRNEGVLTPDETLTGWYSGEPLTYELTLEETSQVTLAMSSSDFDAYLELYGEGVSYSDDDGGQGTDALLQQALLPGSYTVNARGFSASGGGMFELEVNVEPAEMQPDA